jgi:hypothetical protein
MLIDKILTEETDESAQHDILFKQKVLAEAGVDIRSAKFWQGGFDVLDKLVSALEKL